MSTTRGAGPHALQIPGPSNVPEQVLRAMAKPTIDHRGPEFAELALDVLARVGAVFGTEEPVVIYPGSGTGAWEAALVNTLSPGDVVLAFETGHFSTLWAEMARSWGLEVKWVPGDWRHGVDPGQVHEHLTAPGADRIAAVCVVHNETSTGATSRVGEIREAMDRADHSALLLVDSISGIGSAAYEHDAWRVDVTVACSQKGLMLPPGLGINAVSRKAREAATRSRFPKNYWAWEPVIEANQRGFWPSTPNTNLLYGLRVALDLFDAEGLAQVFDRHRRHGEAARAAVEAWGLEVLCLEPRDHSPVLTAVLMPEGHDADALRALILERLNMSLGAGLGRLAGKVFRIGHLGHYNDVNLLGTLGGVELGLRLAGVPVSGDGVAAALGVLRKEQ